MGPQQSRPTNRSHRRHQHQQSKAWYREGVTKKPHEHQEIHNYFLERKIIETENSITFLCIDLENEVAVNELNYGKVVLKFIKLLPEKSEMILNEINLMQILKNEHIIQCTDIFEYSSFVCIVMPFAAKGTLLDHISKRRFPEETVKMIIKQVLEALLYLHSKGIVHRDVKLNNIYITNSDIVHPTIELADFGCAYQVSESDVKKINGNFENIEIESDLVGTPVFIAPEIYEKQKYGAKVDVWSLGIVMYALMSGTSPFPSVEDEEMKWNVIHQDISFKEDVFGRFSDSALNLLQRMLKKEPLERISVKDALAHQWFKC